MCTALTVCAVPAFSKLPFPDKASRQTSLSCKDFGERSINPDSSPESCEVEACLKVWIAEITWFFHSHEMHKEFLVGKRHVWKIIQDERRGELMHWWPEAGVTTCPSVVWQENIFSTSSICHKEHNDLKDQEKENEMADMESAILFQHPLQISQLTIYSIYYTRIVEDAFQALFLFIYYFLVIWLMALPDSGGIWRQGIPWPSGSRNSWMSALHLPQLVLWGTVCSPVRGGDRVSAQGFYPCIFMVDLWNIICVCLL